MPETQEWITFDEDGVCGACRQSEIKIKLDWVAKEKELVELIEQYNRGKFAYD